MEVKQTDVLNTHGSKTHQPLLLLASISLHVMERGTVHVITVKENHVLFRLTKHTAMQDSIPRAKKWLRLFMDRWEAQFKRCDTTRKSLRFQTHGRDFQMEPYNNHDLACFSRRLVDKAPPPCCYSGMRNDSPTWTGSKSTWTSATDPGLINIKD